MKGRSGWKGESRRHSLARKGIRTADKPMRSMGKSQRYLKNDNGKRVFTGKVAENILLDLLKMEQEEWVDHYLDYSGFYKEENMWTAWDNSNGLLSVENFYMKENARSWATDLSTTPTEMHNKDQKDVFREIAKGVRAEELVLYEQSDFTDEIQKEIEKHIDEYDDWYLGTRFFEDLARILQTWRDEESATFKGDKAHITDYFIEEVGERFQNDKAFKNSKYWSIFS